jgi:hypothetical protein
MVGPTGASPCPARQSGEAFRHTEAQVACPGGDLEDGLAGLRVHFIEEPVADWLGHVHKPLAPVLPTGAISLQVWALLPIAVAIHPRAPLVAQCVDDRTLGERDQRFPASRLWSARADEADQRQRCQPVQRARSDPATDASSEVVDTVTAMVGFQQSGE